MAGCRQAKQGQLRLRRLRTPCGLTRPLDRPFSCRKASSRLDCLPCSISSWPRRKVSRAPNDESSLFLSLEFKTRNESTLSVDEIALFKRTRLLEWVVCGVRCAWNFLKEKDQIPQVSEDLKI